MGSQPFPSRRPKLTGMAPIWHPSPNFGDRRDALRPTLIVLHYTAMESAAAALERLCDPSVEVSAHYLIGSDGTIWQMVDEAARAWHAGAGEWAGQGDVNSRSIGIELDNRGDHPFSNALMMALEALLPGIMERWGIGPEGVIGHSDFAPTRKFDPGKRFDWRRLAQSGRAVWPNDNGPADHPERIGEPLTQIGYPVAAYGVEPCLRAFRDRVRPWKSGAADGTDMALALDLARRFGVDPSSPVT